MMFLSSVKDTPAANRIREIIVFMLLRALILAVLGLSAAIIGRRLFSFQSGIFIVLGALYISIGLLMIFSQSLLGKLRDVRIVHWLGLDLKKWAVKKLGFVAGFTIPGCAIPLITVLLGQSLLSGNIVS